MDHMAALAKGFKIFGPIIGGIMIKVSGRQYHLRYSNDGAVANESKARQRLSTNDLGSTGSSLFGGLVAEIAAM